MTMTKENLQTEYCNEYGYEVFNKYNDSNYTKFLEDKIIALEKKLNKLPIDSVSKSVAKQYAEFCIRCDRGKLPLLCLEDYIKQYCT